MRKKAKIALIAVLSLIAAGIIVFFVYVSDYYHADDVAVKAMAGDSGLKDYGNFIVLPSSIPGDTGLIFYPGGKVEYIAYIPLLEKLQRDGITCVLVKMPFNLLDQCLDLPVFSGYASL